MFRPWSERPNGSQIKNQDRGEGSQEAWLACISSPTKREVGAIWSQVGAGGQQGAREVILPLEAQG